MKKGVVTPEVAARPLGFVWAVALCVLGGLLMFAAFPPLNVGVVVWIGLVPLMTALWFGGKRPGRKGAFCYAFYGWMFGLVYYGGSFWWINEVSTLGFIPLVMYLALYPALWAVVMGTLLRPEFEREPAYDLDRAVRKRRWTAWAHRDMATTLKVMISGGALWVCCEWLRGWVMTGFGWNSLGVALYDSAALAQFAEYVGVTALSFLPAVVSICLWCVGRRLGKMIMIEGRRISPWDFFGVCIILMLMFLWGSLLVNRHAADPNDETRLPVLAIQRNMSQEYKWDPDHIGMIYREMADSTRDALSELQLKSMATVEGEGVPQTAMLPAWVIWPESSLPIPTYLHADDGALMMEGQQANPVFFGPDGFFHEVREAAMADFVLITGSDERLYDAGDGMTASYNVMTVITEDFSTRQTYRKTHLVPFGEYIPLRKALPFLERAFEFSAGNAMGANFDSGDSYDPLVVPVRPGDPRTVQVIPSVCFEDTVGRLMRKFVRNVPQVIVNVTNDGWFNDSFANEQHWRNAAFRAIELRRSMIRSSNTGVTTALAPSGGVIADLRDQDGSPFLKGYVFARLPVSGQGLTLYALFGDWAVGVCFLIVLIVSAGAWRRGRRISAKADLSVSH